MYEFHITTEEGGHTAALGDGEHTLGSGDTAGLWIPHPSLSELHARLTLDGERLWVEDLGSDTGSFLDGQPVAAPVLVAEGQQMQFGGVVVRARHVRPQDALMQETGYEVGAQVARGGMGAVHGAQQRVMGREVAMKVMLRAGDERGMLRFINEARITGRLEHPNIVPVHELGVDEQQRVFYTMKLVRGTTLAAVLEKLAAKDPATVRRHPLPALLTVFQKVCDALAFAHSHGIIHRDLKPENIMLGDYGEVLVMDWGLAKDLRAAAEAGVGGEADPLSTAGSTLDGSVMGTPAYMPPEQARGETHALDERSDIYSLGAILHELLYLRRVVSGTGKDDILARVAAGQRDVMGPFPAPHLPGGRVPVSLRAVSDKALSFDPVDRYPRVVDLQADITAYQNGFATDAEGAGLGKQIALFIRRHQGVAKATAAALLALAAVSIWFTLHLITARDAAEEARAVAETEKTRAQEALALVEPARIEATTQRDKATAALKDTEAARDQAAAERDRALKALAQTQAIRKRATDALKQMQNAGDIFAKLSGEYVRYGQVDEALENIDRALRAAPQNPQFRVARANLLQACGRFSQAIPEYRRALALRPDPQVAANLALTEKLEKEKGASSELSDSIRQQLDEALKAQNRALEAILLDPPEEIDLGEDGAGGGAATAGELEAKIGFYMSQPGWNGKRIATVPGGGLRLDLRGLKIGDLSMLRGSRVVELHLGGAELKTLPDLSGMSLRGLRVYDSSLTDITPLRGMTLTGLHLIDTKVTDISPIKSMPIKWLHLNGTPVASLEPIRDMPVQELHLPGSVEDFTPVSTLIELTLLSLPDKAHGIDFTRVTKLRNVHHPRFCIQKHWMPGAEFIRLSHLSDAQWLKWKDALATTDAKDLHPSCLTVLSESGFDLDLRRTGITKLQPLSDMPLYRLYLDTKKPEIDLAPLAGHRTLRHLWIKDSHIEKLSPAFPGSLLDSITLHPGVRDIHLLAKHPALKRVGYSWDDKALLPRTSREDFFDPRVETPEEVLPLELKPLLELRFDRPEEGVMGWDLDFGKDKSAPVPWNADPQVERGRGGGCISFVERHGNGVTGYFAAPKLFHGDKRALIGGCLEFQLRQHQGSNFDEAPGVILGTGKTKLVHALPRPPGNVWTNYVVPLRHDAGWHVDKLDGPAPTEEEFNQVMTALDDLRIRAEFTGHGEERCDLDDLRVWKAEEGKLREAAAAAREEKLAAESAWTRNCELEISDSECGNHAIYAKLPFTVLNGHIWLDAYEGRQGVLMTHPLNREKAGKVRYKLESPAVEGSRLRLAVRGSSVAPGVILKAFHQGKPVSESPVNAVWQEIQLTLPAGCESIDLEVWPVDWSWEYCFIDDISVQPPP